MKFRRTFKVETVQNMGSDEMIARAAWEQEMAEKIRAKFLGPDFGRNPVNGQDSPDAALHAAYDEGLQTALALLEGGDNQ